MLLNYNDNFRSTGNPRGALDHSGIPTFIAPMDVKALSLPGLMLLKPRRFADSRGYFVETYNEKTFAQAGVTIKFVQDNQSFSLAKATVRALHFQLPPAPQTKLVRVLHGSIFDIGVDLRVGSPTYARHEGVTLSADGGEQLLVPRGFAHGFCTLEPNTVVAYKVDAFYVPASDNGLIWNDPELAVDWPVAAGEAVLSDKDQKLGRFKDFKSPFVYERP